MNQKQNAPKPWQRLWIILYSAGENWNVFSLRIWVIRAATLSASSVPFSSSLRSVRVS